MDYRGFDFGKKRKPESQTIFLEHGSTCSTATSAKWRVHFGQGARMSVWPRPLIPSPPPPPEGPGCINVTRYHKKRLNPPRRGRDRGESEGERASEQGGRGGERGAVSSHLRHDWAKKAAVPREASVISHFHYEERSERRRERTADGGGKGWPGHENSSELGHRITSVKTVRRVKRHFT